MRIREIKRLTILTMNHKNAIVKVIIQKKENSLIFDAFLEQLNAAEPLDITIVEDFSEVNAIEEEDLVDQSDDTLTTINKFVDSVDIGLDKVRLKGLIKDIYMEAHSVELEA